MYDVIVPAVTPMRDDAPDLDALSENVAALGNTGLTGIMMLGSSGEFPHLNPAERKAVLKAAQASAPSSLHLYAHTGGGLSTRDVVDLTEYAFSLGYEAAFVITPYYFARQLEGPALETFFKTLVGLGPVYLYHIPGFTGVNLSSDKVKRLRDIGIAGMKDSSGNMSFMSSVLAALDANFRYLVGSAGNLLPALSQGAKGGIMATANVIPDVLASLARKVADGDLEGARRLSHRIIPLNEALTQTYGIAGLKYATEQAGYRAGPPRLPLPSLSDEGRKAIDRLMQLATGSPAF